MVDQSVVESAESADQSMAESAGRSRTWPVVVAAALAEFVVGGYRIGVPSLWRDEAATISGSQRSAGAIWALMRNQDAVHGAYYFLMHAVIAVGGTSGAVLRLPSLIAMSLAAGLTAALGTRLARASDLPAPRTVGLIAGLMLAAVPLTTRYAQEARPYALTTLFAVLATYLLVGAVTRVGSGVAAGAGAAAVGGSGTSAEAGSRSGARWRTGALRGVLGGRPHQPAGRSAWWAGYAVALVLTGLFNLFAVLLAVAHGASLLAARRAARLSAPPSPESAPISGSAAPASELSSVPTPPPAFAPAPPVAPATEVPASGLPAPALLATEFPATGLPATGLPAIGLPAAGLLLG